MARYRVVTDKFAGFEVQRKRWWWSPWVEIGTNTHSTLERALHWLEEKKRLDVPRRVVWEQDKQ